MYTIGKTGSLLGSLGFVFALVAMPHAALAAAASQKAGPAATIDAEKTQLTNAQFNALPDSQILLFKGRTFTVGEVKTAQRDAAARQAAWLADPEVRSRFAAFRGEFLAKQKAQIDAEKAKGLADYESRFGAGRALAHPR